MRKIFCLGRSMDFKSNQLKIVFSFIESPISNDPNIHRLKQLLEKKVTCGRLVGIQQFLEEFKSLLMIPLL